MPLGKFAKIGICWSVITVIGITGFVLAKNDVEKQRYKHMKVRERMQNSNVGEYSPSSRKFSE